MRRAIMLLAALALAVSACDGEVVPVTVPDFAGMRLPDARESANDLDLELEEVDGTGRDRAVFSSDNWSVESQEPDAGAEVEPGDTVTLTLVNDRDEDDAVPEPVDADEADPDEEPEPKDEPEPEAEDEPTAELDVDVREGPSGLRLVTEADYVECRIDLNAGLIRSGYTTRITDVVAGDPVVVPWGELTDRDGERFDYSRFRPEMVTIDCDDEDGGFVVDTFSW